MLSATLHEWKRKIEQLQQRWRGARQENERLRKENEVLRRREKQWESEREQWERERKRLERERERLRGEIDNLKRQLEEAQRANKRQAAPFSRGTRKEHPKTPGRKPGAAYGRRYCKLPPKQVDEIVPVPLPWRCSCRGRVVFDRTESQYQQEIVRKTIWRRFDIDIGHCEKCHKRVQGRDSRQTSDALGAAKVQLGPEALALAVRMNKDLAMPHADVAAVLRDGFQLQVNRSTIARAVDRVARRGAPTWHALRDAARRSMVNGMDETGWNVAAQLRWHIPPGLVHAVHHTSSGGIPQSVPGGRSTPCHAVYGAGNGAAVHLQLKAVPQYRGHIGVGHRQVLIHPDGECQRLGPQLHLRRS